MKNVEIRMKNELGKKRMTNDECAASTFVIYTFLIHSSFELLHSSFLSSAR